MTGETVSDGAIDAVFRADEPTVYTVWYQAYRGTPARLVGRHAREADARVQFDRATDRGDYFILKGDRWPAEPETLVAEKRAM